MVYKACSSVLFCPSLDSLSVWQVAYSCDLFLEKNKDFVVMEHQDLLGNSKHAFIAALFPAPEGEKAKTKFTSLGSGFKVSDDWNIMNRVT